MIFRTILPTPHRFTIVLQPTGKEGTPGLVQEEVC